MGWLVRTLTLALFASPLFPQQFSSETFSQEATMARWAQAHATPLGDLDSAAGRVNLAFLSGLVGSARLLGLGEARHGIHEALLLRNLIFRYLAENLGFTAIALETDFAEALAIDDYVTATGAEGGKEGAEPSRELVASVWSIGAPQAWEENRQLIQWMRRYNSRPGAKRQIHFYGLEMMGHSLAIARPLPQRPFEAALDYMSHADPLSAQAFREQLTPLLAALANGPYAEGEGVRNPYDAMGTERQNALTLITGDLVSLFERRHVEWIAKTSELAYHRGYRSALNARALDADFRARGWWISRRGDRNQRDATSAQNLSWALDREGPQGRILFVAHNVHVATSKRECKDPRSVRSTSLGEHLKQMMGNDVVVIATVQGAGAGEFSAGLSCVGPDTLHGALPEAGLPAAFLDLGEATPRLRDGFDAALFLDKTIPARECEC